jgi:hypothetical protein
MGVFTFFSLSRFEPWSFKPKQPVNQICHTAFYDWYSDVFNAVVTAAKSPIKYNDIEGTLNFAPLYCWAQGLRIILLDFPFSSISIRM